MLSQYYLIRIYRQKSGPEPVLCGTLEKMGASERLSFTNPQELIAVLFDDLGVENADDSSTYAPKEKPR